MTNIGSPNTAQGLHDPNHAIFVGSLFLKMIIFNQQCKQCKQKFANTSMGKFVFTAVGGSGSGCSCQKVYASMMQVILHIPSSNPRLIYYIALDDQRR